ncbi:MAG: hypothetical protein IJP86_05560 [Synergistaceae bacterium]|nr:hypothetical protein [Synergistaceae bacterium]
MNGFVINVNMAGVERMKSLLLHAPKLLEQAMKNIRKEVLKAAKKSAASRASEEYFIKKSGVTREMTLRGDSLVLRGYRQNLADYKMSPKRPGYRKNGITGAVMREGGMKKIPSGFVIRGKSSGKILGMIRTGKPRKAYKALISPAVPQLMENPRVQEGVVRDTEEAVRLTAANETAKALRMWR